MSPCKTVSVKADGHCESLLVLHKLNLSWNNLNFLKPVKNPLVVGRVPYQWFLVVLFNWHQKLFQVFLFLKWVSCCQNLFKSKLEFFNHFFFFLLLSPFLCFRIAIGWLIFPFLVHNSGWGLVPNMPLTWFSFKNLLVHSTRPCR